MRKYRSRKARRLYKSASRRTKKNYRRRYKKVSIKRSIWKSPIPRQGYYKFTYHDTGFPFATDAVGAFKSLRQFRGNSLYDPDYTGLGVQPYGYDNLCNTNAPFGRYLVYASKITVYPHIYTADDAPENTTGSWNIKLSVYPTRLNAVSFTDFEDLCRIPYHKSRCIENVDDAGGNNTLKRYVSTRKIWAEGGGLQDIDFGAAYNSNPINTWFWNIMMDTSSYSNAVTGYFDVKIKYYCKLFKQDDINES